MKNSSKSNSKFGIISLSGCVYSIGACFFCAIVFAIGQGGIGLPSVGDNRATSAPTDTQEAVSATNTPQPSATVESILPTSTVAIGGLGVTRAELQELFEKEGFVFTEGNEVDGLPRILGMSPAPQAVSIELIGELNNLQMVTLLLADDGKQESTVSFLFYCGMSTAKITPDWNDSYTWISTQFSEADKVDFFQASTTFEGIEISFSSSPDLVFITFAATQ